MLLFLDTNILLDFYRIKTSRKLLDELAAIKTSLIVPEQIVTEFRKNRFKVLHEEIARIEASISGLSVHNTYIVDEVADLVEKQKPQVTVLKDQLSEIKSRLNRLIEDPCSERIFATFEKWFDGSNAKIIKLSDEIYRNALLRRDLKRPPESANGSLGDQIVWESLLKECSDDLVYVTRDAEFKRYQFLLQEEFASRTKKKLTITEKLSDALSLFKVPVSEDLKKFEGSLGAKMNRWQIVQQDPTGLVVTDGVQTGFMPNVVTLGCPTCGSLGPWNGARCLSCGDMLDD